MEFLSSIKRSKIRFNLNDSSVPSKLPKEVKDLMGDIADVAMYVKAYKEIGGDHEAVPFGRIKREEVIKAKEILDELTVKVKEKDKLEKEKSKESGSAIFQQEMQSKVEEISELSSNYYHQMPKVSIETR